MALTDRTVDDTLISLSPSAAKANLGDEMVLLDTERGLYFGVNEVGSRIVDLLGEPRSLTDLVDRLLSEFEVSRDRLTRDVTMFVEDMERNGLLVRKGPPAP